MNEQLQRLRDGVAKDLAATDAEFDRLRDRMAMYRHFLAQIDAEIAEAVPSETADETERRREKRDIRGAVLAVLQAYPLTVAALKSHVERNIGALTDSALARSLSSLVGDGSIIERDGVFSLPPQANPVSKLGVGFLAGEQAAK